MRGAHTKALRYARAWWAFCRQSVRDNNIQDRLALLCHPHPKAIKKSQAAPPSTGGTLSEHKFIAFHVHILTPSCFPQLPFLCLTPGGINKQTQRYVCVKEGSSDFYISSATNFTTSFSLSSSVASSRVWFEHVPEQVLEAWCPVWQTTEP